MSEIRIPVEEALRYMGAATADEGTRRLAEETAKMLEERLQPRYLWRACRIDRSGGGIALPEAGLALPGTLAEKMLAECDTAALLVCTLGAGFDRLMKEWEARDMARAAVMDVCGSAWTEAVCDAAEAEIRGRFPGLYCTDRFSPGYGDLPLELQKDISRILNMPQEIGVSLTGTLLMTPSKSVTALIGVSDKPGEGFSSGCGSCKASANCPYRA